MDKTFIDKLAYIYIQAGKILCTRSRGKDTWYIPGGKREPGESDEQALVREVEEELTVKLVNQTIRSYGVFEAQAHGKPEGTLVRMTCYTADFAGTPSASNEIEEVAFLSYADKSKTSLVDHLIFDDLRSKGLIS
jgi:8-oxo-dGTP pyrophosphatase MutT (NUDIX family)